MQNRHGFTLIELMIVIAILGILASITIVNLSGSTESAKEQKCRNNLRQLQAAVTAYAMDQRSELPVGMSHEVRDAVGNWYERRGWVSWVNKNRNLEALDKLWDGKEAERKKPKSSELSDDLGVGRDAQFAITAGTLYEYVGDMRFYKCPKIEKDFQDVGEATIFRTYAMTAFYGAPSNPKWYLVNLTNVGTSEKYGGHVPEASRLLLFSEIAPSVEGSHTVSRSGPGANGTRGTKEHDSDCCFDPEDYDKSDHETIYCTHKGYKEGGRVVKLALAVFLDGHIDKVGSTSSKSNPHDGTGNVAWYLSRGFEPSDRRPGE